MARQKKLEIAACQALNNSVVMSQKTESECLFQNFCSACGIHCTPVPTSGQRSPDYEIIVKKTTVFVEVKEIDCNTREKFELAKLEQGEAAVLTGTLGGRARKKLAGAAAQLKNYAKGKSPTILVLHNKVPIAAHTDPDSILVAMYGEDTFVIGIPTDAKNAPFLKERIFGGKRTMTKSHNTSISAVGVLGVGPTREPYLILYHNVYAAVPLDKDLFLPFGVEQLTLAEPKKGKFQQWSS